MRLSHAFRVLRLCLSFACLGLGACASAPLAPYSTDTPPLVLAPAAQAGIADRRGRFREIFCSVLDTHGRQLPDYRPCDEALTRVGDEPDGTGQPVESGPSERRLMALLVPGIGYDCVEAWLAQAGTAASHVAGFGYELAPIRVDALSGSTRNARQIRDALLALPADPAPRVVLVGYSKGTPDILEAIAAYPEIRDRIAAVVSVAGAVGGSPLADDSEQYQADLLRHFPGAHCEKGDGEGVASLRTATRRAWLATHPLPQGLRYYSLATFPQPDRISGVLKPGYRRLAAVDARNDGQLLFYDQLIPGSSLLGYLNADHWAVVLPIARSHATLGSLFVTQNAYPREALLEAVLRFVEEDLRGTGD
jgi:hypothetical protein